MTMVESSPARHLAGFVAVLIGVLLAWPLLPRSVAAESGHAALARADSEDEVPGRSGQRPYEANEPREADDSESENSDLGLASATDWALGCELAVHRITTLARRDPHVSPGHARLARERGPPAIV